MNKTYYSLLWVMGASLFLSLLFCPPFDGLLNDREFFQYTGMAILRGQVPYRDFFDHKPPMIYFLNALGLAMGMGRWGLWIISTFFALAITFLLFRRARQYRLHYPWLLPLLFNLMIRDFLIAERINLTREYSTFFVMLFFCVLVGKHRHRYLLLGIFTALTFFTQQDQVLLLIPLLLYSLATKDSSSSLARFAWLSTGFLSVTVVLVVYFAVHGALGYFWADAYVFNFTVYIREYKSMGDHFRTIKRVLDAGNYELPFMIAVVLGLVALFQPHKKKGLLLAALAALFLSMSSEWMGGRVRENEVPVDFLGYFVPLSATVCILLFVVFAYPGERALSDARLQLPYVFLLCSSLVYTALQHATHLKLRDDELRTPTPELQYLRQQKLSDYQLCVLFEGDYTYYYNDLKILSPSRYIYQHFWTWFRTFDPDHLILKSIGDDLLRHHTLYVVMPLNRLVYIANPANRDWWVSFMQSHYQPVQVPGGQSTILWKWKDN